VNSDCKCTSLFLGIRQLVVEVVVRPASGPTFWFKRGNFKQASTRFVTLLLSPLPLA